MKKFIRIVTNIGIVILFIGVFKFEIKCWNMNRLDILLYESDSYIPLVIIALLLIFINIPYERKKNRNDYKKKD